MCLLRLLLVVFELIVLLFLYFKFVCLLMSIVVDVVFYLRFTVCLVIDLGF